jgi:hypothetical protein
VTCPCIIDPMASRCGDWDANQSACFCVECALEGRLPA